MSQMYRDKDLENPLTDTRPFQQDMPAPEREMPAYLRAHEAINDQRYVIEAMRSLIDDLREGNIPRTANAPETQPIDPEPPLLMFLDGANGRIRDNSEHLMALIQEMRSMML